ncbi:hypothetical protein SBOR_2987 [Sclerotinia borealis F-4128]|uniref:HhH-GPD domain-containing protein n=1 Tax=Sclerotinia borealis (strain F-4128) TaxID=1432307 RepID=W9CQ43_SCLBF|nr:hypothetical protein SBOR_2987 [Sclerotinia borealis F-4128]
MTTRAATNAAAAAAQILAAATLSSPPITPDDKQDLNKNVATGSPTKTRKRVPPQKKAKLTEPVMGGWDVLPHGMGKKGDLLDDNFGNTGTETTTTVPKRATRARATRAAVKTATVKDEDEEKPDVADLADPFTTNLVEAIKEEIKEEKPKKKSPRKKAVATSTDLTESPSKPVKTKKDRYGLVPGQSPFPDHVSPTTEEAEMVNSLLAAQHGDVKTPETVPAPSETVTGCGEVPDALDATMRTLLSAATTAGNANKSMAGLKKRFGLRTSGKGTGSVSWEAVHAATEEDVVEAIRSGGLANVKGKYIKAILKKVFDQNAELLESLLKEADTDVSVPFIGKILETKEQKEAEIKSLGENMLSIDHIHALDKPRAMQVLTDLPGIGVKTAACVILFCMGKPSFAVDTHVWRHCKWLGWVPTGASRDQTFSHCEVRIPDHLKYSLHQLFLRHGKTCARCRANTSEGSEKWESTVCPIEHLVNRTGDKKQPGYKASRKVVVKKGIKKLANGSKKRKREAEDSEEESEMDLDVDNEMEGDDESEEDTGLSPDNDPPSNIHTDSEDFSP